MNGDRVRMYGVVPFATRMTVVRLASGGLWLHSPVRPTPDRRRAVDELGPVEHLVAPNKIHGLGIAHGHCLQGEAKDDVSRAFAWIAGA